jgi:hypothetical protein
MRYKSSKIINENKAVFADETFSLVTLRYGITFVWETRGRRFKSSRSDHFSKSPVGWIEGGAEEAAARKACAAISRGGCFGGRQIKMPKKTPCTVAKSLAELFFPEAI